MTTTVNAQNITLDKPKDYFSVCHSKMSDAAAVIQTAAGKVFGFCSHPITVFFVVGGLVNSYLPLPECVRFPISSTCGLAAAAGVLVMQIRSAEKATPAPAPIPVAKTSHVVEITKANYKKEVLESKTPVILDAYATWCPPCKAVAPIFDELSYEMKGKVKFVKFNVDSEESLAKELDITAMPTFLIFKDGKILNRQRGVATLNKNELGLSLIKHLL